MGFYSMAASRSHCAATSLLCEETNDLCFDDLDSGADNQNLGVTNDDSSESLADLPLLSEEVFSFMVESEREHLPREDYLERLRNGALELGSVRKEAIDWIWKACFLYGFGPLSVCLSVNYLDRFLSLYEIPRDQTWAVQLLAVTCLSLATKMEEPAVPLNVDLQVGEPKFMFEGKTIQRMELLLLKTLDWKMKACTPFSFIDYFIGKINDHHQHPSRSLISRSVQLILSTIKGTDFLEFKHSEVAAAVALHVSGKIQPDDIPNAVSCFINLEVRWTKWFRDFTYLGSSSWQVKKHFRNEKRSKLQFSRKDKTYAMIPNHRPVIQGRMLKCVEMLQDLPLLPTINVGIGASVPQSPIGVLDAATSLNSKIDDLTGGSFDDSSYSTPETKRRKLDCNLSQETNFKS